MINALQFLYRIPKYVIDVKQANRIITFKRIGSVLQLHFAHATKSVHNKIEKLFRNHYSFVQ